MSISTLFHDPTVPEQSKICTKCGDDKPLAQYHHDSTQKSGYRSQCRDCRSRAKRQRRPKELDPRSQINRNALLRLVHAHRVEFESYVNAETIRTLGPDAGTPVPRAAWIQLA